MLPAKPPRGALDQRGSGGGFPGALPSAGPGGLVPRVPQEEQKPVGGGQPSGSGPNRDQWDQAAGERLGWGLREALTAILGVMAAQGKGEGWGGWAGAQDRGGVHGAGDHSRSRDVLGLEVNAGAGGLVCESRGGSG